DRLASRKRLNVAAQEGGCVQTVFADRRAWFALLFVRRIHDHQQASVDRRLHQPLGERHLEAQIRGRGLRRDGGLRQRTTRTQQQQTGQPDKQRTEGQHIRSPWVNKTRGPGVVTASARS